VSRPGSKAGGEFALNSPGELIWIHEILVPKQSRYQRGWIETRRSNNELVFAYRLRERSPEGGSAKRILIVGPVSVLKTETNAWRAVEHRMLEITSKIPDGRPSP
jgi:hypothetical protein